jgi:hypothetical protein
MKTLFKLTLIVLILLIIATPLVPIGWFAWRAGQPMEMSGFNGLTYYQYVQWQKITYQQHAEKYQAAHPNVEVNPRACFQVQTLIGAPVQFLGSGFFVLAGKYPVLQRFLDQSDIQAPSSVTWTNFIPLWWQVFEEFLWGGAEHSPNSPVVYCRIQPGDIPTSEEFKAMRDQTTQTSSP